MPRRCARSPRDPPARSVPQCREAVLCIWAREQHVLSIRRRGDEHPLAWPGRAAVDLTSSSSGPSDTVLLGADPLRDAVGARTAGSRIRSVSIRWAVSAGEALPPAIFTRFRERFGVEILDGSVQPKYFISSFPISPGASAPVRVACRLAGTKPGSSMTTGRRSRPGRSATC